MKEIRILVKEVTTKEGKKFNSYKAVQKDGKLIDLRFTKAVKNAPTEDCIIVVKEENVNIDKSRLYPRCWVKEIEETLEYVSKAPSSEELPF